MGQRTASDCAVADYRLICVNLVPRLCDAGHSLVRDPPAHLAAIVNGLASSNF